ncbi:PEP-CTERM sorting domain-containing protein [Prosthecobacter sp.]|uniref:PEP-CTERM sorting domain-containing protein n=1 Tax=Prosthecobacter sp. TaxID=1965333 RepID=UPI002ABCE5FE|nr:PEP-CTERM sorting domain-containing protein [Prosthecobacter sp.]MDZ4403123.1 PEP-CTERM sorting domain-containing protein [Prosthecobacter sp.]
MQTLHHTPRIGAGALAAAFSLFGPLASLPLNAAVTITDSFTRSGPLNGDTAEFASSGSYAWTASGPNGGGYYANGSTILAGPAGDDVNAPTTRLAWVDQTLGASERAVLSLDVSLVNNLTTDLAWSSISFLNNPYFFDSAEWNSGQMTLRLMNTGEWWVLGHHYGFNSQDILAHGVAGSAPGFVAGGLNNLKLDYDNATNLLSAYINNTQVMAALNPFETPGVSPNSPGFEPTITASGFHMYAGDTQGSAADNFSLVITTSGVPEPSRLLLLASGGITLIFRRRRTAA